MQPVNLVRWIWRSYFAAFVMVGLLFVLLPDQVLAFMADVGAFFGTFAAGGEGPLKFWLSLGFAYMVVVSVLAFRVQQNPETNRDLLTILAWGKGASSLSCLVFYYVHQPAFVYLANFVVDGQIALVALWSYRMLDPRRLGLNAPFAKVG